MLLIIFLAATLVSGMVETSFVDAVGLGIAKEVVAVANPIEKVVVSAGSSHCDTVQSLIGVSYNTLEKKDHEPDVSKLTLVYRDESVKVTFNISTVTDRLLRSPDYRKHEKLYIFVHGFTDDPSKNSFTTISDALLKKGESNVIALDASPLIGSFYLRSATYVRYIGEKLGQVLAVLVNDGVDPAKIHMIGHSLGAHISGFTGKTFLTLTGHQLGRISGLDPAGPCFSNVAADLKLKSTDAAFVDIVHTDRGILGINEAIGQVDFYPNGGKEQPNCLSVSCSHSRAWEMYAESVANEKAFPAVRCPSWGEFKRRNCTFDDVVYMGFPTPPGSTGRYYLQTLGDEPYALGDNGTYFKDNQAVIKKIGESAKDVATKLFG